VRLTEVASPAVLELDLEGVVVELPGLGATRIGLLGRHQAANAGVANAVLDALEIAGIANVPAAARREGFASARWPGRLERITWRGREILLDGAHNPAGAAALAAALDELRPFLVGGRAMPPAPITLVTGVMADKDVKGLVTALAGAGALAGARIIATRVDLPRALAADDLAARWGAAGIGATVTAIDDLDIALETALEMGDGPIVVAGSLYLVGEARRRWHPDPALDDPPREDPTTR
jgi:dihydrofolate synthase/folylpolyglutamate synthase